jgi:hypothetical protein
MRRRTYIGALASGVGLLAGCTGDGGDGSTPTPTDTATPEPTDTPTPEPTETPTPEPTTPQVEAASLIWNGEAEGTIEERSIETAGAGGHQFVGVRTVLRVNDDKLTPKFTVDIADSTGETVATESFDAAFDAPDAQYTTKPFWVYMDLRDLDPGRYSGTVTVTDTYQGRTSDPTGFEFELVEPLTAGEVTLVDAAPEKTPAGEPFRWRLTLENRTSTANSVVGDVSYSPADANYSVGFRPVSWSLPPSTQVRYPTHPLQFEPGTYEFSVSEVDVQWETTVADQSKDQG